MTNMKIYQLAQGRGVSEICLAGGLLDRNEQTDKVAALDLGEEAPEFVDSIGVRVHFKRQKPYKMPDISVDRFLTYFSQRAIDSLDKEMISNIKFIPVNFVCAGAEDDSGVWDEVPLSEYPFEITQKYYAAHPISFSEILDKKKTLMSTEYMQPSAGIPPGNYLKLAFNQNAAIPLLFVLPGRTFGMLASEQFIKIAKKKKLVGIGKVEFFDTSIENELSLLQNTEPKYISTMENTWHVYNQYGT